MQSASQFLSFAFPIPQTIAVEVLGTFHLNITSVILLWWHLGPLQQVVAVEASIVLGQLPEPAHLAKTILFIPIQIAFLHYVDPIALGHQALTFQGTGSVPSCGHHFLYSAYWLHIGFLVLMLPRLHGQSAGGL